jgi:hypothetical protein
LGVRIYVEAKDRSVSETLGTIQAMGQCDGGILRAKLRIEGLKQRLDAAVAGERRSIRNTLATMEALETMTCARCSGQKKLNEARRSKIMNSRSYPLFFFQWLAISMATLLCLVAAPASGIGSETFGIPAGAYEDARGVLERAPRGDNGEHARPLGRQPTELTGRDRRRRIARHSTSGRSANGS